MLRYISADGLKRYPKLRRTMFQDRARQFADRLGWDVGVDANGEERDQYDALDPLYVVWELPDGAHGGSLRFLPTTGRTMVGEHFPDLVQGVSFASPYIWECTRFCLGARAGPRLAPALMLGGLEAGLAHGLTHAVGVFDRPMMRVYARLGWPPAPLGQRGTGARAIAAGLWDFQACHRAGLLRKTGISAELSARWLARSGLCSEARSQAA